MVIALPLGLFVFFFKQKTAYEMCGRDWSSDVCSSDLVEFLVSDSLYTSAMTVKYGLDKLP